MALNVSFISLLLASAPRLAQVPSPESNSPRVERIPHHATERVGAVGQRQMAVFGGQINTVHGSLQQDSQFEVQLLEDSHQIFLLRHCGTLRAVKRVAGARDLVGYHPAEKAPIIMHVGWEVAQSNCKNSREQAGACTRRGNLWRRALYYTLATSRAHCMDQRWSEEKITAGSAIQSLNDHCEWVI